jgi:hypothetical protein
LVGTQPTFDAGAAVHLGGLLDQDHSLALASHPGGQRLAALAEAENENVHMRALHAFSLLAPRRADKA